MHYVIGCGEGFFSALEMLEDKLARLEAENYSVYLTAAPVVTVLGRTTYIMQTVNVQKEKPPEYRFQYTSPQIAPLKYDNAVYTATVGTNQLP